MPNAALSRHDGIDNVGHLTPTIGYLRISALPPPSLVAAKAMKRATAIGERAWGGTHPFDLYRLSGHFYAAIPDSRSTSPINHTNWEGKGVEN